MTGNTPLSPAFSLIFFAHILSECDKYEETHCSLILLMDSGSCTFKYGVNVVRFEDVISY